MTEAGRKNGKEHRRKDAHLRNKWSIVKREEATRRLDSSSDGVAVREWEDEGGKLRREKT